MTTQPDFRALCAELLAGLDENRHEEVRYPGHLRIIMAEARTALNTPPLAPIPVSERLPGPEALKGGYCWFWLPEDEVWFWERPDSQFITDYGEDGSWLPHWAIPLPEEPE
jgi:hypothetical protein